MKVLIISDTHRNNSNYEQVYNKVAPIDMVIHCGDIESGEYSIACIAGCPTQMVIGNNDFFSDLPKEKQFQLGKYKVWLTHGHNYCVSMGNEIIKQEARERGVDIVMYGHTHKPCIDIESDIIALNPGSLTFPRQDGRKPSYLIMDIDQNEEAHFSIFYL